MTALEASAPPAWSRPYVGLPFVAGADGPRAYDCWGLVRRVLADRWSVTVPEFPDLRAGVVDEQLAAARGAGAWTWRAVALDDAREGDVLEIQGSRRSLHVALVVAPGWMLHVRERASSCLERYLRPPWSAFVRAVHRHQGIAA